MDFRRERRRKQTLGENLRTTFLRRLTLGERVFEMILDDFAYILMLVSS